MQTMTVGELKAHFSDILEKVRKGEEIVISYGKKREKVAVLLPYSRYSQNQERKLGILKGHATCVIHDDFKITEQELLRS